MDHEREIVEKIKSGDREAFSEIVREHQKTIYYLALRWTGLRLEAEDIVQQTFLNAYTRIQTFRMESSLKTWLYQIALNLLKNHKRFRQGKIMKEADETLSDDSPSPLEQSLLRRDAQKVLGVLDRLAAKQRATLFLRLYEGLAFKEIAQVQQISENSAKVNFHYALKNARELLRKEKILDGLSF